MSDPMLPEAPGRFSTITGCPSACRSCSPTTRAKMSVEPPGAQGTTIRTGRVGYACARAEHAMAAAPAVAPSAKVRAERRVKGFTGALRRGRLGRDTKLAARLFKASPETETRVTFTTRPEIRGTFGAVATTHWIASAVGMS